MRIPSADSLRQIEIRNEKASVHKILSRVAVDSLHFGAEPDLGVGPVLVGCGDADSQGFCGLRTSKSREIPQFDQFRFDGILLLKSVQGDVESQELVVARGICRCSSFWARTPGQRVKNLSVEVTARSFVARPGRAPQDDFA